MFTFPLDAANASKYKKRDLNRNRKDWSGDQGLSRSAVVDPRMANFRLNKHGPQSRGSCKHCSNNGLQ